MRDRCLYLYDTASNGNESFSGMVDRPQRSPSHKDNFLEHLSHSFVLSECLMTVGSKLRTRAVWSGGSCQSKQAFIGFMSIAKFREESSTRYQHQCRAWHALRFSNLVFRVWQNIVRTDAIGFGGRPDRVEIRSEFDPPVPKPKVTCHRRPARLVRVAGRSSRPRPNPS